MGYILLAISYWSLLLCKGIDVEMQFCLLLNIQSMSYMG